MSQMTDLQENMGTESDFSWSASVLGVTFSAFKLSSGWQEWQPANQPA